MAAPVFLSYSWQDATEVDQLDDRLRWRGVPMWRDRRAMEWGGYNETLVKQALRERCSGFALYLTKQALHSGSSEFIPEIELPEMDGRRQRDESFFSGSIFRGYGVRDGAAAVRERTGIQVATTLGSPIADDRALEPQLVDAANAILASYLGAEWQEGPATVFFDTRQEIRWHEDALLHISWHPPLAHALDACDGDCWDRDLVPALRALRDALHKARGGTRLVVRGQPHLSAALALGHTFRAPGPWSLECTTYQGGVWETGPRESDDCGWEVRAQAGETGGARDALLVCVHATHEISRTVRESRKGELSPRATLDIWPPVKTGHTTIDAERANGLACATASAICDARREYATAETHLYMACPWPFAALLGYHLASAGAIVSYEATEGRDDYRRACRLT